mmetsp:Transcript_27999/g.41543  ORF Transcript_27999/g.41543 Transcript_27999/m.41543 type:complete len:207 (+) Transcript_27999:860-1480(+)
MILWQRVKLDYRNLWKDINKRVSNGDVGEKSFYGDSWMNHFLQMFERNEVLSKVKVIWVRNTECMSRTLQILPRNIQLGLTSALMVGIHIVGLHVDFGNYFIYYQLVPPIPQTNCMGLGKDILYPPRRLVKPFIISLQISFVATFAKIILSKCTKDAVTIIVQGLMVSYHLLSRGRQAYMVLLLPRTNAIYLEKRLRFGCGKSTTQ